VRFFWATLYIGLSVQCCIMMLYHGTLYNSCYTQGRHLREGTRGRLPQAKNNMQCKTTHTRRHILARRLPCHCDVQTFCLHFGVEILMQMCMKISKISFVVWSFISLQRPNSACKMYYRACVTVLAREYSCVACSRRVFLLEAIRSCFSHRLFSSDRLDGCPLAAS